MLFSIDEAAARLSVGRTNLYRILGAGELPAVKLGKRTMIRESDLQAYIENLPTAYPVAASAPETAGA